MEKQSKSKFQTTKSSVFSYIFSFPFILGLLLRLLLFVVGIDQTLSNRKEIVTPITSVHRVIEGSFLAKLGHSPYAGDVYHQPPLLLLPFTFVQNDPWMLRGLFVLLDLLCALIIRECVHTYQKNLPAHISNSKNSVLLRTDLGNIAASMYLFNPLSVMTCVGMSTIIFSNISVLLTLYFGLKRQSLPSLLFIAVATYLSIYPVVLLFPVILFLNKRWISTLLLFGIFISGLMYLSFLMFDSWDFLVDTYGFTMMVSDLSPNIGLFWYFFTEVFKQFRNFYLFAYQYHVFIYAIPLYIRLWRHPIFLFWLNLAIIAAFKSYTSAGDISLQMALLPLIFDEVKGARNGFLVIVIGLFGMVLAPIFWLMWIYHGTGNANFYYGINLALTAAQIIYMADTISCILKEDYLRKKASKQPTQEQQ